LSPYILVFSPFLLVSLQRTILLYYHLITYFAHILHMWLRTVSSIYLVGDTWPVVMVSVTKLSYKSFCQIYGHFEAVMKLLKGWLKIDLSGNVDQSWQWSLKLAINHMTHGSRLVQRWTLYGNASQ